MFVGNFGSSDLSTLKQYMPIPLGGLKFVCGFINFLMLIVVFFVGTYFVFTDDEYLSEGARILAMVSGGGALLVAINFYVTGAPREWITSYFARNVRGYIARFWVHETETVHRWYCDVVTSESDPNSTGVLAQLGGLKIQVRLGGWISFGGSGIRQDCKLITHASLLRNWRVRPHKIYFHTGVVLVEVSCTHPFSDGKHEKIVLEVSEAIRLLNLVQQPDFNIASISDALRWYRRRKDELTTV